MKIKYNHSQMSAFIMILERIIEVVNRRNDKDDIIDWLLLKAVTEDIYGPLQQKFFIRKSKYSFTLKPYQALAMYIIFNNQSNYGLYEANLIRELCGRIHKEIITDENKKK